LYGASAKRRESAANYEAGCNDFSACCGGGSADRVLEERQFSGRHVSGSDRHHVRDDRELYGARDARHGNDCDDDDEIDDQEIDRKEDGQKVDVLAIILRADATRRPQGPTARRALAVVGANRTICHSRST